MTLRTKLALLSVLALLLWAPATAMASSDAGSGGGNDLVAQDTDDENDEDENGEDENGTDDTTTDDGTDDNGDSDETGVPATGAGGATAAGGISMMLVAGLIAFLSATAAGAFAYLRRS